MEPATAIFTAVMVDQAKMAGMDQMAVTVPMGFVVGMRGLFPMKSPVVRPRATRFLPEGAMGGMEVTVAMAAGAAMVALVAPVATVQIAHVIKGDRVTVAAVAMAVGVVEEDQVAMVEAVVMVEMGPTSWSLIHPGTIRLRFQPMMLEAEGAAAGAAAWLVREDKGG